MTFSDLIAALEKEIGTAIETEGGAAAIDVGASDGAAATILLQSLDEKNALLMTADLGLPPPERLERLYRIFLEANDLFRDTGGSTLSVDPATGHARLQRYDTYEALAEAGAEKTFLEFADAAASWTQLVHDYRAAPEEKIHEAQDVSGISGFRV